MYVTAPQMADLMPDARQLLSDEPEMESTLHYQQLALLVSCLEWQWRERQDYFIGANLTVYYSHQQLRRRDFRGPDFFLVLDTTPEPRNSWVVWEEGERYPDLIIELLSDSTAGVDRADKKSLYQNIFRTSEYFWFSPETLEFQSFRLVDKLYQPIPPNAHGHLPSQRLGLSLGILDGRLRYFEASGTLVQTLAEAARQEIARAEQERARAERESERAASARAGRRSGSMNAQKPQPLRIPYGLADFIKLRRGNEYYVDKTHYLPVLESAGRFLFLIRLRRFGKSLLQSVMECYYDREWTKDFDALFAATWIADHPTVERGAYLTLRFDFSMVSRAMPGGLAAVIPAEEAAAINAESDSWRHETIQSSVIIGLRI